MTTINSLLGALEGSQGIAAVKKQFDVLEKKLNVPKHIEKTKSEKIERSLIYENTSNEQNKWQEIVTDNRHKKTLYLTDDTKPDLTFQSLISKFEPSNKMEKDIQMVLLTSGTTEKDVELKEEDELLAKGLTYEEIRNKQNELAKVKARLFYEQIKRHRINKIKSKAYHRIKKKQNERRMNNDLQLILETNPDKAKEILEEKDIKRIKERMNLKHKNTGKWARMALEHGRRDKSLRESYHASVELGRELMNKANETIVNEDNNSTSDDEDLSSDENDSYDLSNLAKTLDNAIDRTNPNNYQGKFNKLFDMPFMKKGEEMIAKKLEEETKQIILDLHEMENNNTDSDNDEIISNTSNKKIVNKKDDMIDSKIDNKNGNKIDVIPLPKPRKNKKLSFQSSTIDIPMNNPYDNEIGKLDNIFESWDKKIDNKIDNTVDSKIDNKIENNIDSKTNSKRDKKIKKKKHVTIVDDIAATVDPSTNLSIELTNNSSNDVINNEIIKKPLIQKKSQSDLIQMAFAGPDLEAEFTKYKNQSIDDELGYNEKRKDVLSKVKPGWGDWAGPGNMLVSEKIQSIRDKHLSKISEEEEQEKNKRIDKKLPTVIISEKRNKKAAKYMLTQIPHPFTTREEYEKSLRMPLGDEWNSSQVVKVNTRPSIITRPGRIIEPIKLSSKRSIESIDEKEKNYKKNKTEKLTNSNIKKVKKIK